MTAKPGEVWLDDLGLAAKTRPVVILSRDDPQAPRALVIYVPLTTQNRGSPYEVELGRVRFLSESSVANVQGLWFHSGGSLAEETRVTLNRNIGEDKASGPLRAGFVTGFD